MLIRVRCRHCDFAFKVQARFAGKVGTCPQCSRKYLVPAPRPNVGAEASREGEPNEDRRSKIEDRKTGRSDLRPSTFAPRSSTLRKAGPSRPRPYIAGGVLGALGLMVVLSVLPGHPAAPPVSIASTAQAAEPSPPKAPPAQPDPFAADIKPFFETHCLDCHGPDDAAADIGFHKYASTEAVLKDRKTWDRVLNMISSGAMPPADYDPQPTQDQRDKVAAWIDKTLYFVDCGQSPDPGRVTIRRLNRAEYNNTIRDLVGVDFKPAENFPSDDVGYGFDNIGDVLSLPPLLMEKYLTAAEKITADAIAADPLKAAAQRAEGKELKGHGDPGGDGFITLASTGEVFGEFEFPRDGEYVLRAVALADQAGPDPARMEFRIDDKPVKVFDIEGDRQPGTYEITTTVSKGRHKFAAAFLNDYYKPEAKDPKERGDRNLAVRSLEVQSLSPPRLEDLPELHRRIVFTRPDDGTTVRQAAEDVLRKFTTRAFRRPVTADELAKYVGLVEMVTGDGETFERGIQIAVQAVLVSPQFLFRIESDPAPNNPSKVHPINDYELASRLSYFLWSSMPDEELFRLAEQGKLHEREVLVAQARRMLQDPKSRALVVNFGMQWLNLRNLDDVSPDPRKFRRAFNRRLKEDMRRETQRVFADIVREDRSIFAFLDADFTYVNERLAEHYDIDGIEGDEFRKVSLPDDQRRGILTHASILTLTSNPTRTSPVKRGKWIMENILGTSPPPPPPDVPLLEEIVAKAPKDATVRQQLELHRANPACASCHTTMDQLGFGLENFDAIGRWRDKDNGQPIDASGTLPGGDTFDGPVEMVEILKKRDDPFRKTLTEKLLTYALGRGLEYYDKCAVDEITEHLAENGDRFSELVVGIVTSDPFLLRRGERPE